MFLYLQCENGATGAPMNRYHCRGECSQAEAGSFAAALAKRGSALEAFASPLWLGDAVAKQRDGSFQALPARLKRGTRPAQASFDQRGAA